MEKNLKELTERPVGRLLWEYSVPAVVGMVVMSLYNVIDRIFIGQGVGPEAIAGLAVTFPLMNLTTAIGVLVGVGASSRVSIVLGAGKQDEAQHLLGNALVLTALNAVVYIALFAIFLDPILRAFGASDVTLPYGLAYARIYVTYSLNNIMRASGYPGRAMFTMLIGAGCNLVLAPIFIFGLKTGIKGAAIATDLSMTVSAVFVISHFLKRDVSLRFTPGTYRLRWATIIAIVSIGAAPALVNAASCFINAIINTSLYRYGGDMAVGAAGIYTTFASLITTVVIGICQGMQPIVGYNYGAGSIHRLQRAYLLAVASASVFTVSGSMIGLLVPESVARAFTSDATLIASTSKALTFGLMMFSVVGFQIVSTSFFQSIGKAWKSIFLSLTRQVLFLIPLLLVLPRHFGLDGVWGSFPISDTVATLVTGGMILWQFREIRRAAGINSFVIN